MRQDNVLAELEICDLELQDAGDYTCVCGDQHTVASLTVNGKFILQMTAHFSCFSETSFCRTKCSPISFFLGINLCSGKENNLF